MLSAATNRELYEWLRRTAESGNVSAFLRRVAGADLITCSPDYEMRRPVLLGLKWRYPEGKACPI
jgi:hypothetical protein